MKYQDSIVDKIKKFNQRKEEKKSLKYEDILKNAHNRGSIDLNVPSISDFELEEQELPALETDPTTNPTPAPSTSGTTEQLPELPPAPLPEPASAPLPENPAATNNLAPAPQSSTEDLTDQKIDGLEQKFGSTMDNMASVMDSMMKKLEDLSQLGKKYEEIDDKLNYMMKTVKSEDEAEQNKLKKSKESSYPFSYDITDFENFQNQEEKIIPQDIKSQINSGDEKSIMSGLLGNY